MMHNDEDDWEGPKTTAEKVSALILLFAYLIMVGLAWYAFMYPIFFRH